jgi:regulatory protein
VSDYGCGANERHGRLLFFRDPLDGIVATITALKVQKKNRDRVSVFLDGRFAFGLPAIVAVPLKVDQILSDAEIEALQEQGYVEGAYNHALNFLSYRPRSRAEVVTYLQRRDVSEQQAESIIARLERVGLLNDDEFARFWVENRERHRPKGLRALRYELRGKGLGDDVIERALASVDVSDGAYRAAGKRARQLSHLDGSTFRRKMVAYLARRGFDYEVARDAVERHWSELGMDE